MVTKIMIRVLVEAHLPTAGVQILAQCNNNIYLYV